MTAFVRRRRPVAGHRGRPVRASARGLGRARQDPDRSRRPGRQRGRPPGAAGRGRSRLVAPMADDAAGRLLREALLAGARLAARAAGDAHRGRDRAARRGAGNGRCSPTARRSTRPALAPLLEGLDWIHCSGYPLLDDRTGDAAGRAARRAATAGAAERRRRLGAPGSGTGGALQSAAGAGAPRPGDHERRARPMRSSAGRPAAPWRPRPRCSRWRRW